MKKIWAVALAALCLALPALAAQRYEAPGLFSFEYPDGWTLDETTYASDNDETYTWLCDVEGDGALVSVSCEMIERWEDFTLAGASAEDAARYRQDIEQSYYDLSPRFERTVTGADGETPFLAFTMSEGGYEFLYAATMTAGRETAFQMRTDGSVIGEADRAVFEAILTSYTARGAAPEATPQPDETPAPQPAEATPDAPAPLPTPWREVVRV